jgi:hypothetical protein
VRQSAFTILTEVDPARVEDLERLLREIGDDIAGNAHLRFARLRDLHYACFAVVTGLDGTPSLLFEGNVDGRTDAFLRQLVTAAGAAVDEIYGHCTGYPPPGAVAMPDRALAYLEAHDIGADTFYVAWPGWTVEEIRREHVLRERIEDLLDAEDADLRTRTPDAVRARIADVVRHDHDLHWARVPHPVPFLVRQGRKVLGVLVAAAVVPVLAVLRAAVGGASGGVRRQARAVLAGLLAVAGGTAWALRRAEAGDDAADRRREVDWATTYARWSDNLPAIVRREDVQVQNHMVSVTEIKPGRLRYAVLRLVLWVIDLVARLSANRGRLGGIASIHFARWVITPDRRQLIFLSNFDGSWERYLTDFIDRAATGLTAVWSNTTNDVGFPSTRWLVQGGARDEARFKAYSRYSMVPTSTWYSAYPDRTVSDIANRMEVRRALFASLDADATRSWLRRF